MGVEATISGEIRARDSAGSAKRIISGGRRQHGFKTIFGKCSGASGGVRRSGSLKSMRSRWKVPANVGVSSCRGRPREYGTHPQRAANRSNRNGPSSSSNNHLSQAKPCTGSPNSWISSRYFVLSSLKR